MLDLKRVREETALVKERLAGRGDERLLELVDRVVELDEERRSRIAEVDALRARRNEESPRVAELKRAGRNEEAERLIREMREVAEQIAVEDARLGEIEEALQSLLLQIPNLPEPEVPSGGEEANQVIRIIDLT